MTQSYGFNKQGAKRIVDAVRTVEANDPLYAGQLRRRRRSPGGPEQFIVARVTGVDATTPLLFSATEQYWNEADSKMIDLPRGRVWDGEDGNLPKARAVDGQPRGIDELVTLGHRYGDDGASVWYAVPEPRGWFYAKVTSSSSSSEDHTIVEIDANGDVLTDGREPTDAKAINGRQGVPVDTLVIAFDLGTTESGGDPVYRFMPWDGLTASPRDLINTGTTADTTTWDVRDQGSDTGAEFDPARSVLSVESLFLYDRGLKVDASGMVTLVDGERETFITADSEDSPKNGHITLKTISSGGRDGKDVLLNQPQALDSTVTFTLTAADEITIDGSSSASHTMTFDDSGRYRDGTQTIDYTIGVDLPTGSSFPSSTTVEVVTDVRVDASTFKIQKKTRNITVLAAGAESAWTDVHTGEECA